MVRWIAVILCFFGLAASESFGGERPITPRTGGTLRIGLDGTIPAVDPFKGTRFRQLFGFTRLYAEGLTDLDRQANIVPALAESWEITPDGRVYTFKLRRGVKLHNGEELTAEDVKWSFDHTMDPKSGAQYRANLDLVEAVDVVDRYTLRVRLKNASTPFLSNVYGSLVPIVSRHASATLESLPIGTGPFVVEEWKQGFHLRLRRFKEYWNQGRPYVDEVVLRFVPDESVRFTALRVGDVDIADELPPQRMAELKGAPQKGFRFVGIPGGSYMRLMINTRRAPLNDVRIRQAIAFALDKQGILTAVRWGAGEASNQLYSKSSPWYLDVEDRKQDLTAARRLLAEAGFPRGLSIPVIVVPYTSTTAQVVQAQLRSVGIQLEFEQLDVASELPRQRKGEFDLDFSGLGYPIDPDRQFTTFYSQNSARNYTGYSNPDYDRLYERALVEPDFQKRKLLYTEMMRMIQRDVPEILLWSGHRFIGWRDNIKGFDVNPAAVTMYQGGGLETTWIDRP